MKRTPKQEVALQPLMRKNGEAIYVDNKMVNITLEYKGNKTQEDVIQRLLFSMSRENGYTLFQTCNDSCYKG